MSNETSSWLPQKIVTGIVLIMLTIAAGGPASALNDRASESSSPPPVEPPPCVGRTCGHGITEPEHPAIGAGASEFVPGEDVYRIPVGSSYLAGCDFVDTPAGTTPVGETSVLTDLIDGVWPVDYWIVFCDGTAFPYTFYADGDPPPVAIIEDMIVDAYSRTPVVAFNPITSPDGDEDIALVVHLPTYLWVDDVEWSTPVTATATIPGFSVTTTATAASASWSGGEEAVECQEADMIPYDFARGEDNQLSNCYMVYTRSSAVGPYTVDLAARWDVSYTCSVPVCGGTLPAITTSSTRSVVVKEILSVGS